MEKYDLIIVGAGPAGIFTAVELLRRGSKKHILLVEKGKPVEKRHCPKAELGHCVNCRPTCAITTGLPFSTSRMCFLLPPHLRHHHRLLRCRRLLRRQAEPLL